MVIPRKKKRGGNSRDPCEVDTIQYLDCDGKYTNHHK